MISNGDFFSNIANNILSSSAKEQKNKALGLSLYDDFSSLVLLKYKQLTPVKKKYLTVFYKGKKDILSVEIQTSAIKITLNAKYGLLDDKKNLFRDVSNVGHWGNGDYQVKLDSDDCFDYVVEVIKQIC